MSSADPPDPIKMSHPETLVAQALGKIDPNTRSLVPPIYPSTTYERDKDGGYSSGRGYTRADNPNYEDPQALLAELEQGSDCLLFSSGMAAASAVFMSLDPGDHVIAPAVMYWALRKWLKHTATRWGLEVEFVDTDRNDAVKAAIRPGQTKIIWLETPANPTWSIADIESITNFAHAAGAKVCVDSTVATPVFSRPLEHGADLVMHSATKYLNGHSDVLAGALVCKRTDELWQRIDSWRKETGAVLGPFEAWLLLRGMRTLFVRVQRCADTAFAIASYFENNPRLECVLYPGLISHPQHLLAAQQMQGGFGGMLSIRVKGGEDAAMKVAANLTVFKRATSLGGVESLVEHRASVEGPDTPVPNDLLRLSVGLEHTQDLIDDLSQALDS